MTRDLVRMVSETVDARLDGVTDINGLRFHVSLDGVVLRFRFWGLYDDDTALIGSFPILTERVIQVTDEDINKVVDEALEAMRNLLQLRRQNVPTLL